MKHMRKKRNKKELPVYGKNEMKKNCQFMATTKLHSNIAILKEIPLPHPPVISVSANTQKNRKSDNLQKLSMNDIDLSCIVYNFAFQNSLLEYEAQ